MFDISIIIPTYNEAENVVEIVEACLQSLSGGHTEVVVVDDDSPDGTWQLAEEQYGQHDQVTIIRRTHDSGLGSAVLRGIDAASGEICVVIDADFQHPPGRLPDLVNAFDSDTDLVIGSRFVNGGGIDGWSQRRRLISRIGQFLARLNIGRSWRISDPMSGFFAVRRELVIEHELSPEGFKILLELVARVEPEHIIEVGYTFQERRAGDSNLDGRETLRFLRHILGHSIEEIDPRHVALLTVGLLLLLARPVPVVAGAIAVSIAALIVGGDRAAKLFRELATTEVETSAR